MEYEKRRDSRVRSVKKRQDRVEDLRGMFHKQRQKDANDGREGGYEEIMTELLFLILFDLRGLRTLFCVLIGGLLGFLVAIFLL